MSIVEDENHAFLVCNKYKDLRNSFFNKIGVTNKINNINNKEKYQFIFNSDNMSTNLYVANFVKKITDLRYLLIKFT